MTQDSTGTGPRFREAGNGCRTIDVNPPDVRDGRLQQLIDAAVAGRPSKDSNRVTICLQPGRYELQQAITLRDRHSNLALRGCSEAAVISAATGFETAFGQGLIVLVGANNVTGLELVLLQIPAALARVRPSRQQSKAFAAAVNAIAVNRRISIGIRPVHYAVLASTDYLSAETNSNRMSSTGANPAALLGVASLAITGTSSPPRTRRRHHWQLPLLARCDHRQRHHRNPVLPNRSFPAPLDSWLPLQHGHVTRHSDGRRHPWTAPPPSAHPPLHQLTRHLHARRSRQPRAQPLCISNQSALHPCF